MSSSTSFAKKNGRRQSAEVCTAFSRGKKDSLPRFVFVLCADADANEERAGFAFASDDDESNTVKEYKAEQQMVIQQVSQKSSLPAL